jgi:hypothetical protein
MQPLRHSTSSELLVMDLAQVDGNKPDGLIDSQPIQAKEARKIDWTAKYRVRSHRMVT